MRLMSARRVLVLLLIVGAYLVPASQTRAQDCPQVDAVSITPNEGPHYVGDDILIQVLTSRCDQPAPYVTVSLRIEGPNAASAQPLYGMTDANGETYFNYRGFLTGQDTLVATAIKGTADPVTASATVGVVCSSGGQLCSNPDALLENWTNLAPPDSPMCQALSFLVPFEECPIPEYVITEYPEPLPNQPGSLFEYFEGVDAFMTQASAEFDDAASYCLTMKATIVGTASGETIQGTEQNDVIAAKGGNDTVFAKGGLDLVCGNDGADDLNLGYGRDGASGGNGDDFIEDRNGDRAKGVMGGLDGNDTIHGNDGDDYFEGNAATDYIYDGFGWDEIWVEEDGAVDHTYWCKDGSGEYYYGDANDVRHGPSSAYC